VACFKTLCGQLPGRPEETARQSEHAGKLVQLLLQPVCLDFLIRIHLISYFFSLVFWGSFLTRISYCILILGTAVAQWLRCYATNRKVAGSIPDGVTGIFH